MTPVVSFETGGLTRKLWVDVRSGVCGQRTGLEAVTQVRKH